MSGTALVYIELLERADEALARATTPLPEDRALVVSVRHAPGAAIHVARERSHDCRETVRKLDEAEFYKECARHARARAERR